MSAPHGPDQTKTDLRKRIDPSPDSENGKGGVPNLETRALRRVARILTKLDALSERLEADADRVATFERMDADRTDLPGAWPSLFGEPEGGDR